MNPRARTTARACKDALGKLCGEGCDGGGGGALVIGTGTSTELSVEVNTCVVVAEVVGDQLGSWSSLVVIGGLPSASSGTAVVTSMGGSEVTSSNLMPAVARIQSRNVRA